LPSESAGRNRYARRLRLSREVVTEASAKARGLCELRDGTDKKALSRKHI
jgi:hypothetical protein